MRSSIPAMVLALFALLLCHPASASSATEDWKLDKQENGIDVYTRPVPDSGIKEFRGIANVDVSVDAIVALLRDSDRFKTWFPNTPESKLIEREGDVSYQYSVMGTPWPMDDRDNVLRSVLTRDEETGVVDIVVTAAPDYYPTQKGRHRVRKADGTRHLEPIGPEKTRVTFTMHLEPGGGIPQWMINTRIVATPFEALTNLRTVTRK